MNKDILLYFEKLYQDSGVLLSGPVLQTIDASQLEGPLLEYVNLCISSDQERAKKRLELTSLVKSQNEELKGLVSELEEAEKKALNAKEQALKDADVAKRALDLELEKKKSEMVNWAVKWMIYSIIVIVVVTVAVYLFGPTTSPEAVTITTNLLSQILISALASSFTMLGGLLGVKHFLNDKPQ